MCLATPVDRRPISRYARSREMAVLSVEAEARGGGRRVPMTSFHHSIGIHCAVPRLLGLCALVALPGLASCQDAAQVVIEEASVTAGASHRPSLPRTITLDRKSTRLNSSH